MITSLTILLSFLAFLIYDLFLVWIFESIKWHVSEKNINKIYKGKLIVTIKAESIKAVASAVMNLSETHKSLNLVHEDKFRSIFIKGKYRLILVADDPQSN